MNNVFRRIVILFILLSIFVFVTMMVFFKNHIQSARTITDVDNLSGQKIAVVQGWEGDYILTDRKDLTLLRYDTQSDALVALCYKQVDAYAQTLDGALYIQSMTSGLKINDKPLAVNGMTTIFREDSELLHEFNDFIEIYSQTDEYQEYLNKCDNQEFYDGSEILEETGTGKTIRVGYCVDYIPISFTDTKTGKPNGSEIDFIRRFANYMNYKIEWKKLPESGAYEELNVGNIDIMAEGYSDVYRDEFDISPTTDMSIPYRYSTVVILSVDDYDNLSIAAAAALEEE